MLTVIDRYILKSLVTNYLIALGTMLSLYIVLDMFVNMDEFTEQGYPVWTVMGNMVSYYWPNLFVYFKELAGAISLFAGLATLAVLREPGRYAALHATGAHLRTTLQRLFDEAEVPAVVSGVDVTFDVYFTDQPVVDYRSTLGNKPLKRVFDRALMEHGVLKTPEKFYVGMCHDEADVELTIAAFEAAVAAVREA